MRALWEGYLKLSLVSCAVEVHGLLRPSERVSFNTLNRKTGNRVRRLYIDAETGAPVDPEEQVKGYEIAEGDFVVLEEEDLDSIALEATRVIDIHSFCRPEDVDPLYLDTPYALVPEPGAGEEAFALIRDAMDASGMAGLGSIVLHRRERPVLLQPRAGILLMTALRFNYEVRDIGEIAGTVTPISAEPEMVALASHIIQTRASPFEPETFTDRYEEALLDLIKAKEAGRHPARPALSLPANVVDLYEALRQSLATSGGGEKRGGSQAKRAGDVRRGTASRKSPPRQRASRRKA
ncbi:Ku protein [Pedomonas sp. V897]|uniref:non-homologous end joining protein Ku n=1 Tax=Pedomonas sp. V897 TaxID=3446482 RepID=UPI003EE11AAF